MDVERFRKLPLMAILRGGDPAVAEPLVETVIAAGIDTLEVAMNSSGALEMLARAAKAAHGRLMLGAGTVLRTETLEAALGAGAGFIVMPTLAARVVERCAKLGVPVFPGAFTPLEIANAWDAGATMVKVFPAKFLGPPYIAEIKGPFSDIELLACGGVSAESLPGFFAAGASAVAFGSSVFAPELLAAGDFTAIGERLRRLVAAYETCRDGRYRA